MATALPKAEKFELSVFMAVIALGFAGGLFAGMTRSPVGATIVSALFGVVGAGGALGIIIQGMLGREKPGEAAAKPREIDAGLLRMAGWSLFLLCVACVAGAFSGIQVREGRWLNFSPPVEIPPEPPAAIRITQAAASLTSLQQAKLELVQLKLADLGVGIEENNAFIISLASESRVGQLDDVYKELMGVAAPPPVVTPAPTEDGPAGSGGLARYPGYNLYSNTYTRPLPLDVERLMREQMLQPPTIRRGWEDR
jgi:hypothetical protein